MNTTASPAQVGASVSDVMLHVCAFVQTAPLWVWPALAIAIALWIVYKGTRRIRMS